MRSPELLSQTRALCPNLQHVLRDKTHASRRLSSRPYGADPYLRGILLMLATGRTSPARMVQHSMEARRVFRGFVHTSTTPGVKQAVTNLRAAGHRFESLQKPLGRSVLHLHSLIKTALHLIEHGNRDLKGRAEKWLGWHMEKRLQAAMMADASDQAMQFTRILDTEGTDPASMTSAANVFLQVVQSLFEAEPPACLRVFGYTSVMLKMLRRPVVWQMGGGAPCTHLVPMMACLGL